MDLVAVLVIGVAGLLQTRSRKQLKNFEFSYISNNFLYLLVPGAFLDPAQLPKQAPIFFPTMTCHELFLNWRPFCYHSGDLGRPMGGETPIIGLHVIEPALDKRWRGWAKPCGYVYIYMCYIHT